MKTFMLCVVAVIAAVGPGVAVAGECAAGGVRFEGSAVQADAVGIARGFSCDGQAVTLLFDNLLVDVGLQRAGWHALRYEGRGRAHVRLTTPIASLWACHPTDLQEAKLRPGCCKPKPGKAVCEARKRAMEEAIDFPEEDEPTGGFDFLHRIDGKLPAGMRYRVTFFLLVERDADTDDVGALLTLDSLDIEIGTPGKTK